MIIKLVALQSIPLIIVLECFVCRIEFGNAVKSAHPQITCCIFQNGQYGITAKALICSIPGKDLSLLSVEEDQSPSFCTHPKISRAVFHDNTNRFTNEIRNMPFTGFVNLNQVVYAASPKNMVPVFPQYIQIF